MTREQALDGLVEAANNMPSGYKAEWLDRLCLDFPREVVDPTLCPNPDLWGWLLEVDEMSAQDLKDEMVNRLSDA